MVMMDISNIMHLPESNGSFVLYKKHCSFVIISISSYQDF